MFNETNERGIDDRVIISRNNFETISNALEIAKAILAGQTNLDNRTADFAMSKQEDDMAIRHRIRIGNNDDGSPIFKQVQAKSVDDLNDRIIQTYIESGRIQEFMDKGETARKKTQTNFRDYAERWMATYKLHQLKQRVYQTYTGYLRTHLYPAFGDKMIEDISIENIQCFLNDRKDLAKKSLKNYLCLLAEILDFAVEDKIIEENPARSKKISNPATKETPREALSEKAIKQILHDLFNLQDCREKLMVGLLLFTGLRRGEALGLKWEDIDFDEKIIHIRRNVTHPGNPAVIGTTKTKSGVRDISFGQNLEAILLPHKAESGFVFGGESPYSRKKYLTLMNNINKKIDLHGATPHTFRHSFLTLAGGENIDLKTLQSMAGHAKSQTTADIYMHAIPEKVKAAGQQMDRLLGNYAHALH